MFSNDVSTNEALPVAVIVPSMIKSPYIVIGEYSIVGLMFCRVNSPSDPFNALRLLPTMPPFVDIGAYNVALLSILILAI